MLKFYVFPSIEIIFGFVMGSGLKIYVALSPFLVVICKARSRT